MAGLEHLGAAVGLGVKRPFRQRLADRIDEYRRLDREAAEASPVGTAFGQVTSALVPVGAVGQATSTAGKALVSGGLGAAGGFLGSEGSATERLPGAAVGAGVGLGLGTVAAHAANEAELVKKAGAAAVQLVRDPTAILKLPGSRGAGLGGALGANWGEPGMGAGAGALAELLGRAGVALSRGGLSLPRRLSDHMARLRAEKAAAAAPPQEVPLGQVPPPVQTRAWVERAEGALERPRLARAKVPSGRRTTDPAAFE
ncbi:MAG TPA: hypothetical protein VJ140_01170, partial [Actinomycetota bacterium]|nr:hypothetical protein [Actinomycetota bacterium]